jgi:CheY-like chemotaxis protein
VSNPTPAKKETIIIAEDSLANQKILHHLLIKLGYNVIACNNGKEAWEQLNQTPPGAVVAIVSDLMMPEEDGLTFLKKVRESERFQTLPFVLVTAISDKEQIVAAKNLKVSGYILKPVTFQRVVGKLKELFPQKQYPNIAA